MLGRAGATPLPANLSRSRDTRASDCFSASSAPKASGAVQPDPVGQACKTARSGVRGTFSPTGPNWFAGCGRLPRTLGLQALLLTYEWLIMLVYVIDLSLHFNAHLVPREDFYKNAPNYPDCVSVDATTFRQAIEAFWASTGCPATLTSVRKRKWLGLLGSYDAVTDLEATIIRGRRRVVVRNVDEPLQTGDVIALDGRFC